MEFVGDAVALEDAVNHFGAVHLPERMAVFLRGQGRHDDFVDRAEPVEHVFRRLRFLLLITDVVEGIARPIRNYRIIAALERNDRDTGIGQDGSVRDGAPEVRQRPDVETAQELLVDDNGRIFLFPGDLRQVLLAHIGEVQGQDATGIGPGRENAFGMDEQRIPLQEEADCRIRVLERPVHRIVRRSLVAAVSLPIIDGGGHIAQGGEITAPFDQRRVALVAALKGASMEGHEQRSCDCTAVLGNIDVHGEVHPVGLVFPAVPDHAPVDDILRFPHLVHRFPVHLPGREQVVFRRLVGLQVQFFRLKVHGHRIGPDGARVPVHEGAQGAE